MHVLIINLMHINTKLGERYIIMNNITKKKKLLNTIKHKIIKI